MTVAMPYCARASRRVVDALRPDATVVIITQLPAAQAISAT